MNRRPSTAASCKPAQRPRQRYLFYGQLISLPALLLLTGCRQQDQPTRKDQPAGEPPALSDHTGTKASPGSFVRKKKPFAQTGGERYFLAHRDATYEPGTRIEFERIVQVKDAKVVVVSPKEKLTGTTRSTQTLKLLIDLLSEREVRVLVEKDREEGTQNIGRKFNPLRQRIGLLEGRTVLFTLKEGEWTPDLDQQEIKGGASMIRFVRGILGRQSDAVLYGLDPLAVGESWTADPRYLLSLGGQKDRATGSGSLQLEFRGVEKNDGTDCAILVGRVNMTSVDALTGKTNREGSIRVARSLTHLANLSVAFDGRMEVIGSPSTGISISTSGPYEMTQRLRIKKTAAKAGAP